MQRLVKPYVEEGIILARSDDEVASTIRSYMVVKKQEEILGFASLFIYTHEFAEVRSLAVAKKHQRNGVGSAVVKALIEEGRKLGLRQILTLTYHSDFFKRLGFKEVAKEEVWHHKVWEDCIKCRHFPVCDELALILNL
jgi:amino-acid N-acetyltransferase